MDALIRWPANLRRMERDVWDMPTAPQYPISYAWHLGPIYEDRAALEARADEVEAEREAIELRMLSADDGTEASWPAYDQAAEEHDLACRELSLLRKRIEELS